MIFMIKSSLITLKKNCFSDLAKTFETDVGQPLLKQACSAFSENGRVVFHEDVYRSGSVSFNLSQSNRSPRHVGVNPK